MMFVWERLRYQHQGKAPSIEELSRLMSRILKLYTLIDQIMKIFELVQKTERVQRANKKEGQDETPKVDTKLAQRMVTGIKLLIKENPILPMSFTFKGKDILRQAQEQIAAHTAEAKKRRLEADQRRTHML